MKLIGNLLLTICLISGMISAATAYFASTDLDPSAFEESKDSAGVVHYARLAAPAGAQKITQETLDNLRAQYEAGDLTAEEYTNKRRTPEPILKDDLHKDGTELTPERLEELKDAKVKHVFLKEFSFARWTYWWVFAISAVGLFVGSMLVRTASKREIAAAAVSAPGGGAAMTPEASLDSIHEIIAKLRRDLPGISDERERLRTIIARLDEAQKTHIVAFIDARPLLVSKMGLGGYSELMDQFAAAERQINRAWSAAADNVYIESEICLARADELLEETKKKIR